MSDQIVTKHYFDDGRPPETVYAPAKRSNFVAPAEVTAVAKRGPATVLPVQETNHTLDVPLSATQHIEMRTSAVDRARGFAISTRQLGLVISAAMLVASVAFVDVPPFSLWSLSIFVLTYAAVWLYAYYLSLKHSPEGIARYESKRKWDVIEREQDRRWDHYDRQREGGE